MGYEGSDEMNSLIDAVAHLRKALLEMRIDPDDIEIRCSIDALVSIRSDMRIIDHRDQIDVISAEQLEICGVKFKRKVSNAQDN